MYKKYKLLFFALVVLSNNSIFASIEDYYPYSVNPSHSNYGNTGLLEIPNARFMTPASIRFSFSNSFPLEFTALTATPFENFEATYRYVEIKNKKYGPSYYSGNQSFKDKAFDIKIGLIKETQKLPSVAIGLRDIGGTGLLSSEYLVFSKKIGSLDLTTGFGWGLLGSTADVSNPLSFISENFKIRERESIAYCKFRKRTNKPECR